MNGHEVLNQVEKGFRMPRPTGGPVACPDPITSKCSSAGTYCPRPDPPSLTFRTSSTTTWCQLKGNINLWIRKESY
ncbi:hypothetical protein DPMN_057035 [Dreissena polymorpha]|uniref:Uncharacterized protein n=1 Tax=Dreissena polymorpha TaxID=45954 RepID=A0A9D4CVQ6_DREPO|nr:hypothetical protein DPMN_057035 [Dreissena polymorpha]